NYIDTRTHEFFIEGSYPPRQVIEEVYACLLGMELETIYLSASALTARVGTRNEIAINSALIYLEKVGHIARLQGRDSGIRMIDRAPGAELRVDWNDIALREAAERRKLREMVNFAYHEKCLRRLILRYFGDRKEAANCRCSNCQPKLKWGEAAPVQQGSERKLRQEPGRKQSPDPAPASETVNVEEAAPQSMSMGGMGSIGEVGDVGGARALRDDEHLVARKILSCIARMEGKFGKGMVASVLRGAKVKNVIANELDRLSTYGLLREYSQDDLTRFINALIVAGCVKQAGGAYPTVKPTTLGCAGMRDQTRVELDLETVAGDTIDERNTLPPQYREKRQQTYALYKQGLGVAEIAERRSLKPLTIEEHLAALIEEGREINLSVLVDDEDRALIEAAATKCGIDRLRPIKDELPDRIGYSP